MGQVRVAALSCLVTGLATLLWVRWPTHQRAGWFELDGRPLALDGERVTDWTHANDVLARSAAAVHEKLQVFRDGRERPEELLDRTFELDYVPRGRDERARVRLHRYLPTTPSGWSRQHPIAGARYVVEAVPEEAR